LALSGTSPPALLASSEGFEAAESIHLANTAGARMGDLWQKKGLDTNATFLATLQNLAGSSFVRRLSKR